jgi:hypothetical protein
MHDSEKLAVRDGLTTVRGMILMAHVERYSSEKLAVPLPPAASMPLVETGKEIVLQ